MTVFRPASQSDQCAAGDQHQKDKDQQDDRDSCANLTKTEQQRQTDDCADQPPGLDRDPLNDAFHQHFQQVVLDRFGPAHLESSARSSGSRGRKPSSRRRSSAQQRAQHQMQAVILFASGIFLAALTLIKGASAWNWLRCRGKELPQRRQEGLSAREKAPETVCQPCRVYPPDSRPWIQVAATMPGISRSGSTISVGMIWGLERSFAVTYSFILGIPAVLGLCIQRLSEK